MIPFDIYVLSPHRTALKVGQFLDRFAVGMQESAGDYSVSTLVDNPSLVFQKTSELIAYLIEHPTEPYTIYYHHPNPNTNPRNVIVSFTNDNHLIVGLTVYAENATVLQGFFESLGELVSAKYGYWTIETPPPLSSSEFIEKTVNAEDPKLILQGRQDERRLGKAIATVPADR